MSIFYKFSKLFQDEIITEEDFKSSKFHGSEDLLETDWEKLMVASDTDEEGLSELYYFIEGNAEHITHNGNMLLVSLSGSNIVLFDDFDEKAIIIHKKEQDNVESFI